MGKCACIVLMYSCCMLFLNIDFKIVFEFFFLSNSLQQTILRLFFIYLQYLVSFAWAVVAGKKLCIPQLEYDQVALLYTGHSSLVLHLCTIKASKQYIDALRRFVKLSLTLYNNLVAYFPPGQTLYLFAIACNSGIWVWNIYGYFFQIFPS